MGILQKTDTSDGKLQIPFGGTTDMEKAELGDIFPISQSTYTCRHVSTLAKGSNSKIMLENLPNGPSNIET